MPKEPDFEPFDDFGMRRLSDAEFDKLFRKVKPEQFDDFFSDFNMPEGSDSADFGIRWLTDAELDKFFPKGTPEQFDDFFLPPDDEPPSPEV